MPAEKQWLNDLGQQNGMAPAGNAGTQICFSSSSAPIACRHATIFTWFTPNLMFPPLAQVILFWGGPYRFTWFEPLCQHDLIPLTTLLFLKAIPPMEYLKMIEMIMLRRKTHPNTRKHTLCEPALSKCTWIILHGHLQEKLRTHIPGPTFRTSLRRSKCTWTFHKNRLHDPSCYRPRGSSAGKKCIKSTGP